MGCLAHSPRSPSLSSQAEGRRLFTCEHAGIGVGHLSLAGEWLRLNPKLCQITGYSREQLLGRPLRDLTLPEDLDLDRGQLQDLLAGAITGYTVEKRLLQPGGATVWAHWTVSLVRTPAGAPEYLLVVLEDISARKEAEAVRATLAAIVRHSADAIFSESLQGAITSWNAGAERLFGYTDREVLGRPVFLLAPPEHAAEARRIQEQVRGGQPVHRLEAVRIRKDGQRICVALSVSPIRDPAGRIIGIARIARDITALKAAEQALQETRQQLAAANTRLEQHVQERTARWRETLTELEQMSYSIIHDMRAPLRAITGFGALVEADPASRLSPESRDYLARMKRAAGRMDALICGVLNYSRMVRQGLELHPVNVTALLRGIVESYPAFQPPKARIRLAPALPLVQGNEAALTQCFSNLLDNAVKFVRPGETPQIEIKAEVNQGKARLVVQDNGMGIPPELHERIFGMFQQGSNTGEGTGIGLAIVRKAAERMGGRAGVESELGRGSRFWVELPLALAE